MASAEKLTREVHWGRCELLVLSSLLFLSPLFYIDWASKLQKSLAFLSACTACNSARLWADPQSIWKLRIDRINARSAAFVYTCVGMSVMPLAYLAQFGVPTWLGMGLSYAASRTLDGRRDKRWLIAHASFHACVAAGMCQVIVNC
ncbi:hypothetical protein M885DRAFT_562767 [Pelagophyceae sp. CCMP2097]|nr:hypothetical protein M885DRAFT_562767 [Pelagophyceae sp. CCMP2097]|mmetsp:Transcript_27381/g.94656  ORF Transcript_27381/g.94656 Transcript_27381/m.94656 type:complete len:146 (-) Transcript_27381:340-777(-)